MSNILLSLATFFAKFPDKNLIVAYSGGIDSQVLLHALSELKKQLKIDQSILVCHINHGLSENAKMWQNFAQQQCSLLGFPLKIIQVKLEKVPQKA